MDHHHHLFGFMESSHFYASLCSLVGFTILFRNTNILLFKMSSQPIIICSEGTGEDTIPNKDHV